MEAEILKKLAAQEEAIETASMHSYNSASSRLRAAAAQPSALAMLQSVRNMGALSNLGRAPAGQSLHNMGHEEAMESASLHPFASANNSRLFAAQPPAAHLALLQQARGGMGSGGAGGMGHLAPAPGGPSRYELAIMQQRLAMEEQNRMRMVAQAAAAMRQQQQQQQHHHHQQQNPYMRQHPYMQHRAMQNNKRPAVSFSDDDKPNKALRRLRKKRRVLERPPLLVSKKEANADFILPKVKGKDYIPTIKSLDSFRSHWNKFAVKAKENFDDEREQHAFVRHHFGKTLSQNRGLEKVVETLKNDSDGGESDAIHQPT